MRFAFLLILLVSQLGAKAQKDPWFNLKETWDNTPLEYKLAAPGISWIDTAIIVASNRTMQVPDSFRYMSEKVDSGKIHYFFVYAYEGKWHALVVPSLEQAMNYMSHPNRDWVVYTEGMGKTFIGDLDRGMRMSAYFNLNVLMMDYPSISSNKGSLGNYRFAIANAREAYNELSPVFDTVRQMRESMRMGGGHMTLFFHSMGNNVIEQMIKNNKPAVATNKVWVDNLVLNAPCIRQRHHTRWLDSVGFAQNIYVNYNPKDKTLYWAELVSFKKQLGRRLRKPLDEKAVYINFNPVVAENHSNFLPLPFHAATSDEAIAYYKIILHGGKADMQDAKLYAPSGYRKEGWDMLPQHSTTANK